MVRIGLALACYPETDETWSYVPPLGLGYLASYIDKYASGAEIVIERRPEDLIPHKPDFVGLTFVTFNYSYAARQAEKIKEALGCPVIAGGPHVSTLPTVLDPVFDFAILGEGEETFAELVRLWQNQKCFELQDLRQIHGLLLHNENGGLEQTPKRTPIKDLDSIPFPNRDLIQDKWSCQGGMVNIMTSRGCPYDCSFCSTIHHWGRGFRYPSNEYVVNEIEEIRNKFDPSEILIFDDLFVVNRQRVIDINNMLRERGLHKGIQFRCFVRANLLNDPLVESLAQTNHHVLNIGFESGSEDMLFKLKKSGCSVEENEHALKLGRKYGVTYSSCFIMGTPGESREDLFANFDFVLSNTDVFDNVSFAPLQVLPMTQVWEWSKKVGVSENNLKGIVLEPDDFDDEKEFMFNKWPYLNAENMPLEEFYNYYLIGKKVEKTVEELSRMRKQLKNRNETIPLNYAVEKIPFSDIIKGKAKRRLRFLMPTEPRLAHNE